MVLVLISLGVSRYPISTFLVDPSEKLSLMRSLNSCCRIGQPALSLITGCAAAEQPESTRGSEKQATTLVLHHNTAWYVSAGGLLV